MNFKLAVLHSLHCPLSKQYRGNPVAFWRLGGRRRGEWERVNKTRALF